MQNDIFLKEAIRKAKEAIDGEGLPPNLAEIAFKTALDNILMGKKQKVSERIDSEISIPEKKKKSKNKIKKSKSKAGLTAYINELLEEGYFKEPKRLEQVEKELNIRGHPFQKKHVSYALLRLIRMRQLRRLPKKEGKGRAIYIYTDG